MLTARVPDSLDDEIAAVLGGGSLGVEIASHGPGLCELRVYLGPADDPAAWRDRAARVLRAHGIATGDATLAIGPVADGRWVERWQASRSPIPLGARFVVLPTETSVARDGREPIVLVPGMAFGTGEHETTRLCAAGVERLVSSGSRWLDLGTGTGILAIVAARCGAARVLAVDLDPEVATVASEVVARNALADRIEVRSGSIGERRRERFDGVVANIQASFFIANAVALSNALVDGGILVASGFLDGDIAEVSGALEAVDIRVEARETLGAWACLTARRPEA